MACVELDDETAALVAHVADLHGKTKSEVVEEAILTVARRYPDGVLPGVRAGRAARVGVTPVR